MIKTGNNAFLLDPVPDEMLDKYYEAATSSKNERYDIRCDLFIKLLLEIRHFSIIRSDRKQYAKIKEANQ